MVADCLTVSLKARPNNREVIDKLVDLLDPTWRIQRASQIFSKFEGIASRRESMESAIARSSAAIEEFVLPVREGPAVAARDSLGELARATTEARVSTQATLVSVEMALDCGWAGLGLELHGDSENSVPDCDREEEDALEVRRGFGRSAPRMSNAHDASTSTQASGASASLLA
jgi:hypothetical protein